MQSAKRSAGVVKGEGAEGFDRATKERLKKLKGAMFGDLSSLGVSDKEIEGLALDFEASGGEVGPEFGALWYTLRLRSGEERVYRIERDGNVWISGRVLGEG